MLRELGHWAVQADDAESIAVALAALHGRWLRGELADSGAPSPNTTEAATRQIIALANESLQRRS
jgi:hypothetical protein